jgi:molybdopterin/thiamine biosynthesis adenylyltransferase
MDKHTNINTRSSGLVNNLSEFNFHILGCGAIGSAAALQLTRMGAFNFCLYDNDIVDTNNIGVSQYDISDIGKDKVAMLKKKMLNINSDIDVVLDSRLFSNYIYLNDNDIIVLGFDSMKSRIVAVKALSKWKYSKPYALIDGRMGAEHYQQYVLIKPNLKKYLPLWYSDKEGSEELCNMKATSYCSNMSGSFISNSIRKIVTKQPYEEFISFHFPTMSIEKTTCVFKN